MTDLKTLRELAEKATQGPWKQDLSGDIIQKESIRKDGYHKIIFELSDTFFYDENANYVVAANPQTILALLDRYERAVEALKKVKHNGCCTVCSSVCPACNAHKALAEIRKKDE